MSKTPKGKKTITEYLESIGGIAIALWTLGLFSVYVFFAPIFDNDVIVNRLQLYASNFVTSCFMFGRSIVSRLQSYGSAGQIFAIFGVIGIALLQAGWKKMLFRIKESRRLDELAEENATLSQRVDVLETLLREWIAKDRSERNETPPKKRKKGK